MSIHTNKKNLTEIDKYFHLNTNLKWLFSSTCKKKNSKCKPEDILICSFDVDNNEIVGKRMDSEFYMSLRGKELCMWKFK